MAPRLSTSRSLPPVARWLAAAEPLVLAALAPVLIFPTAVPILAVVALTVILLLWIARYRALGCITRRTDLDVPVILLFLGVLAGWYASPDPYLSVARATNLVLAVSMFYALVNRPLAGRYPRGWLWLLTLLAAGLAVGGTLLVDWNTYKYPALRPLYAHIPRLFAGGGIAIEPNELAGVLSAFTPAALALVWAEAMDARREPHSRHARPRLLAALALLAAIAGVLVLTQARLALLAAGAVALIGAARLARRPARLVGAVLALVALAAAVVLVVQPRLLSVADARTTLDIRVEVWERGLWTARDFPLTGSGLGTWPAVSNALYGYLTWSTPSMGHPHNVLLSAVAEMGVLGLLAALGLFVAAWRATRRAFAAYPTGDRHRALLFAGAGGMGVFALFGLADAIALGARPSVMLWLLPATVAALAPAPRPEQQHAPGPRLSRAVVFAGILVLAVSGILLWPVAAANLGLITLSRALWHEQGYALTATDPARAGAAEPLLQSDLPGAWRGRAFIATVQNRPAVEVWQRAGVGAETMLAWGLWAAGVATTSEESTLWQAESDGWYTRAAAVATGSHRGMVEALVAQRRNRPEEAIAALDGALRNDAGWLDDHERLSAMVVLGSLHLQQRHYAEAEAALARAVREYAGVVPAGDLAGTYVMLGRAARVQGNSGTALEAFRHAAAAEPENVWRQIDLAIAVYEAGDRAGALKLWEQIAARGLEDEWQLATWADFLARHDEAEPLRTACASAPPAWRDGSALAFCSALLALQAGDRSGAAGMFSAIAAERPREAAPQYWLGRTYESLGRVSDARAAYERALVLAPDEPEVLRRLQSLPQ